MLKRGFRIFPAIVRPVRMISAVLMTPSSPATATPPPAEDARPPGGPSGSIQRVIWKSQVLLFLVSMTPAVCISWDLGMYMGRPMAGVRLFVCGVLLWAWNAVHLGKALRVLLRPLGRAPASDGPVIHVLLVSLFLALLCKHLSVGTNPVGMQQWFFFPGEVLAILLLPRRVYLPLILATMAASTLHEATISNTYWTLSWLFASFIITFLILLCTMTAKDAALRRLDAEQLAARLRASNTRLELQAEQTALLAVEQERNRLAREIHDAVGHSLTVVDAQLAVAEALFTTAPEQALEAMNKARRSSKSGMEDIRRSISFMRGSSMGQPPLAESIGALLADAERPGLRLSMQVSGSARPLPTLVEISLYRCAQEGVTNACRHAGAAEISVRLDFASDTQVQVSVTDDGGGFDASTWPGHGLKGMEERASLLGGEFFAGTGPYGGGLCRMTVPA